MRQGERRKGGEGERREGKVKDKHVKICIH